MKLAIQRIPQGPSAARTVSPPAGTLQVRLGDEVLIASDGHERAGRSPDAREIPGEVPAENLHLVVQLGNMFQRLNPDVPVLVDKGRYLVVDLPPERLREVAARDGCCFDVRPLRESRTVFEIRPPGARRSAPREEIRALAGRLTREGVEADLRHLVSFGTRHSTSARFREAAAWARERLEAMGYLTRVEEVRVGSGTSRSLNVIAEQPGQGSGPRGVVIVTAHLDSVNSLGGPQSPAPGADDNGSGSAGVLAIAHALCGHRAEHDLRLILFGGEEQGLFGSLQHVAALPESERARIRAVINMDMVATLNTDGAAVLIEGGAGVSQAVIDGLAAAAETYTSLTVQTSLSPFNSDHVPFIDAGIPAVLTIEGADRSNQNVHTDGDTLDHIDFDLFLQILTMNVAFVAETLGERTGDRNMPTKPTQGTGLSIPPDANLTEVLRSLPFQFSGRYVHNGGANLRQGRSFVDTGTKQGSAALDNPRYRLEEPVYVQDSSEMNISARSTSSLRFTLHVDVDGADPLDVVSGTVALGSPIPGETEPHFIGRVSSNELVSGGRVLGVTDVRFRWPETADVIVRLTIELSGSPLSVPAAKVFFHAQAGRDYGPYIAAQESMYFREVEMDVDREVNAVDCEPMDTHVHPDRPTDVPQEILTLESAFGKAGIRITRSPGSGTVVNEGSGSDRRWSYSELHDSMELHWEAFANKPQWKMWIFLAELGETDSLGGVMFDGEIDEPGGVDRQGTAIFTRCPYFHTAEGGYVQANPPHEEAIRRELFFNLMHETGHAFNLAHSFQKELGEGWEPPAWMPMRTDAQALSWMNYPDAATPNGGAGANASWFYRRFRFRFDPGELLFLRHAPETYVEMGGDAWFQKHGRVARINIDPRLELVLRSRQTIPLSRGGIAAVAELGEPILLELRLRNVSGQPVMVHANLDPSDGLVELAVTNAKGERRPYLPIDHTRTLVNPRMLQPDERIYQVTDLTMGSFGFPFKEPGPYRIEASYRNLDGSAAAAVLQLYIRPAPNPDVIPVVNELYDARVGRALYVDGTRVMEDVNDKMDWVRGRLQDLIGEANPISTHLQAVRNMPLATAGKLIDPGTNELKESKEEPDRFVHEMKPALVDRCEQAADTMGHIWYGQVLETYAQAAEKSNDPGAAREALGQMLKMFKVRGVAETVTKPLEERIAMLGTAGMVKRGRKKATVARGKG